MSANEVLTKLFFAMQRVKAPMVASLVSIVFNVLAVTVLVRTVGFDGIALASSVTIALCAALNFLFLSRDGALLGKRDVLDLAKSLLAALLMGAAVYAADAALPIANHFLRVIAMGSLGICIYGALLFLLRPNELRRRS